MSTCPSRHPRLLLAASALLLPPSKAVASNARVRAVAASAVWSLVAERPAIAPAHLAAAVAVAAAVAAAVAVAAAAAIAAAVAAVAAAVAAVEASAPVGGAVERPVPLVIVLGEEAPAACERVGKRSVSASRRGLRGAGVRLAYRHQ